MKHICNFVGMARQAYTSFLKRPETVAVFQWYSAVCYYCYSAVCYYCCAFNLVAIVPDHLQFGHCIPRLGHGIPKFKVGFTASSAFISIRHLFKFSSLYLH